MVKKVNPLVGRAAELNEYATNDLSVEENLAGGASVDDLVAAGVLSDDYNPDNDSGHDFTPARSLEEIAAEDEAVSKAPSMSKEEALADAQEYFRRDRMTAESCQRANSPAAWT